MYLPGFVCGIFGLGDVLGLDGTCRLPLGPARKQQNYLKKLVQMTLASNSEIAVWRWRLQGMLVLILCRSFLCASFGASFGASSQPLYCHFV